jgi:hypothetical protein
VLVEQNALASFRSGVEPLREHSVHVAEQPRGVVSVCSLGAQPAIEGRDPVQDRSRGPARMAQPIAMVETLVAIEVREGIEAGLQCRPAGEVEPEAVGAGLLRSASSAARR